MRERLRHVHWGRVPLWLIAVSGVVFLAVDDSISNGVVALVSVTAAVLGAGHLVAPRPRPYLTLEPPGEQEGAEFVIGPWRGLDVEAIVEDGRALANATAKTNSALLLGVGYRKPTTLELQEFAEKVERYAEELRAWVIEVEELLQAERFTLRAFVVQRNPSSVDATEAGAYVRFPRGAEEAPEPPMSVEEPPVRPAFRHKHALDLGLGLATSGGFASVDLASIVRPDIEQFAVSPEAWRSAPDYRKMPDGTLQVTYARKPIRHGEAERAGDEFEVRLPVGEHEIRWEVHAANMARPRRGTWRVSCRDVEEGEPVGKLAELEAALGINCDDENSE